VQSIVNVFRKGGGERVFLEMETEGSEAGDAEALNLCGKSIDTAMICIRASGVSVQFVAVQMSWNWN
jgi:hypothetical protein